MNAEVGLLSGSGASFEGAIARIKDEAGAQGCDLVFVQGETVQSGYGTPGAAYGMSKSHVRAACFVAVDPGAGNDSADATAVTASTVPACEPDCRLGFDCKHGRCVSACNPVCESGQSCVGHGGAASCVSGEGSGGQQGSKK